MKLYYHPLSGYSQKVLVALYEKNAKFEPSIVDVMNPEAKAAYKAIYPLGKVPFLKIEEKDHAVPESSIIIEYIDRHVAGGTKLIPDDPDLARQVRFRDRFFDCNITDPTGKIFFNGMRPADKQDSIGVDAAKQLLGTALQILDSNLAKTGKAWAMGDDFTMADCAGMPALNYAKMVHPFDDLKHVAAYHGRLLERPSVARVLKEAEPFMAAFMAKK